MLQGPGENAGVVDVGDGIAVALKIESHNHPSAVEPFEGAATGVGGIVRDIIAMGARPIALLDSLRFGELTSPRSRHLFTRSVAGIGHYGNCIGVPTVGGEVSFDDRYEESCLVNAMCVGVLRPDGMLRAAAAGAGQRAGADRQPHRPRRHRRRQRAGVGRARRGRGQAPLGAGERPLHRAQADGLLPRPRGRGAFVALQDLGAAGLTSAASEMAAKGRVGLDIDLDLVPLREALAARRDPGVREPGAHARRGAARAARRDDRRLPPLGPGRDRHRHGDRGREPGGALGRRGGGRPAGPPAGRRGADLRGAPHARARVVAPRPGATIPEPADLAGAWRDLLAHPNIASKRWIYERYDHLVGANTIRRPGGDAAVVRLPGSERAIALTTDCAERHCEIDPRGGGRASVLEAARNLACVGARPIAATDCLNFPNPEKGSTGLAAGRGDRRDGGRP